jgi:hypothetical protein
VLTRRVGDRLKILVVLTHTTPKPRGTTPQTGTKLSSARWPWTGGPSMWAPSSSPPLDKALTVRIRLQ